MVVLILARVFEGVKEMEEDIIRSFHVQVLWDSWGSDFSVG